MFKLTGQEKIATPPIDRFESWTSPKVQAYTDAHAIIAFETKGGKILVIQQQGQFLLPAQEIRLRQRNSLDFPDSVIKKRLGLDPGQIRNEKGQVSVLGAVALQPSLYMFLKVPIIQVNRPGWHYINHEDLPGLEDKTEAAFFVLADKLWDYAPVTLQ